MKALDIAIKDVKGAFRSMLMVGFMFGVPILTALIFLLAFGGQDAEMDLSVNVALVNLDAGSEYFDPGSIETTGVDITSDTQTMGDVLVTILQGDTLRDLLRITEYATFTEAEVAVNNQEAGVLIIIPENFTAAVMEPDTEAVLDVRHDPTLTIGPAIVESILNQIVDGFSASKITLDIALQSLGTDAALLTPEQIMAFSQEITAQSEARDAHGVDLVTVAPVEESEAEQQSMTQLLVMGIMGGMMIFYAFFTGANMASTILREEEAATLPRLFSTPTSTTTIMTGKYLAIGLTVFVQITVLVIVGRLIFGFAWGPMLLVSIAILATTLVAATFGVFLISWLDNSKQAGPIIGGAITATGMLGMVPTFTGGAQAPKALEVASLVVPQGWALRLFNLAQNRGAWQEIMLAVAVLVAWSAVFFLIGRHRFSRRYA